MISSFPFTIRDSANLLTRSCNERKQRFLEEMSIDEVCITAKLYSDHSVLYMMNVAMKMCSSFSFFFLNSLLNNQN